MQYMFLTGSNLPSLSISEGPRVRSKNIGFIKSFITDRFKEKESNLIYKIKYRDENLYIFLLIKLQSTVDKFMSLRILRYICGLYEFLVKQKVKLLPPVFPVFLYNGDPKWTAPVNIKDLIAHTIPGQFIPDFRYYPIHENKYKLLQIAAGSNTEMGRLLRDFLLT